MAAEKKLYRSRDALLGGVCAGVAEYFNIDPIIVRIAVAVLTVVTAGLLAIAYIALWVILPQRPDTSAPFEVSPEEVRSDIYERVVVNNCFDLQGETGRSSVFPAHGYNGVGHIPPEPPRTEASRRSDFFQVTQPLSSMAYPVPATTAAWMTADQASGGAPSSGGTAQPTTKPFLSSDDQGQPSAPAGAPGSDADPFQPQTQPGDHVPGQAADPFQPTSSPQPQTQPTTPIPPSSAAAPQPTTPKTPQPSPPASPSPTERGSVKAALFIGFTLLFMGVAALLGNMIEGVYWWQFWPLIFVITGIAQMVIPGKPGRRMKHFVEGMVICMLGLFALPISLDIISIYSLEPIIRNLWPVLVIMCGFFVLGNGLKAPIFTLFAGFCFVAFCVVGIAWFSIPGSTEWIGIVLPNGASYSIAVGSLL